MNGIVLTSRRFLPSLNLLMAFNAVVRLRSVTKAAKELDLTQSTVSRLVKALEDQLGKELFTRKNMRLIPNSTAIRYQKDILQALEIIQRASTAVVVNPQGGTLSLAVLPTFATRWLGPRLGQFLKEHPGVAVNLSTRIRRLDFEVEAFDAAIYFGAGDWAGVRHLKLFDERVTACVSPEFFAENELGTLSEIGDLPMLHLESRTTVWADWFKSQGGVEQKATGMLMDQFSMVIQAAISGLGIALLPDYLAQIEISEGRLVPILKQAVPAHGAYWLVWPEEKNDEAPLTAFRLWLEQQQLTLD